MPRDSGGIYSLPSGYGAIDGEIIQPSQHNPPLEDIANALTASLPRNGAAPMTGNLNMGTNKITGLANGTVATDGAAYGQVTAAIVPFAQSIVRDVQDFRLTLSSTLPVSVADITGASTLYCAPYTGNQISLYVSGAWVVRSSAQFSLALSGLSSSMPYDVFCYDNSTVPTLEFLVWASDTARTTALAKQDGRWVKSGDPTRRYLGTFYARTATTTEDSAANRYLWNYYHRVVSAMSRAEATATWAYTTATWRQANASTSNQVSFIVGVSEDAFTAQVAASGANTTDGARLAVGVGYDSTTVPSGNYASPTVSAGFHTNLYATYTFIPEAGRHTLAWLEWSRALGATTFNGLNSAATLVTASGLSATGKR